jgi:hypothetical protein
VGIAATLKEITRALLGVSAYEKQDNYSGVLLEDASVKQIREALGGQIQPLPTTKLRWYLADLEIAQHRADAGDLLMAAQLYRAFQRDGMISGLLGTRCAGLVRLPKRFYGDAEIAGALQANNGSRSVFDEMFPPSELAMLDKDGVALGVGVAELVPVKGRDYPVMVRLDPENLTYRWTENRWYFTSSAGLLAVTPGDGRWILHLPGARMAPWNAGLWPAIGRAYINKEHAMSCRSNYSAKLANPARTMRAPLGASELERENMFKKLLRWGMNQVFVLPVGWDVGLVESNGIGIQIFQKEIDCSDMEAMVAISGQVVTTTGGTGFANADIHKTIREDLIKSDGDALAYTINTQGLPLYLATGYGIEALENRFTAVEWNTATPVELKTEADTMLSLSTAIAQLRETLAASGHELDVDVLTTRFAIPVKGRSAASSEQVDATSLEADEFRAPGKAKALAQGFDAPRYVGAVREHRPAIEARLRALEAERDAA